MWNKVKVTQMSSYAVWLTSGVPDLFINICGSGSAVWVSLNP